jgi:hypothetical protein
MSKNRFISFTSKILNQNRPEGLLFIIYYYLCVLTKDMILRSVVSLLLIISVKNRFVSPTNKLSTKCNGKERIWNNCVRLSTVFIYFISLVSTTTLCIPFPLAKF